MTLNPDVARNAEALANDTGGFPAQEFDLPGLTSRMDPRPDHGEETYRGTGKLEGLRALITGGDSGIGKAVAIAYAREGADVAIAYLPQEQEDAEDTREWVEKAGRKAVLIPGDLREESVCRETVQQAVRELGGLDILVNNAANQMARGGTIGEMTTDNLDAVFKVNLYAMFWVTQEALPHLGKGASIINTTSIQAYEPAPPMIDYAASKAGITNFTVNLAGQLGKRGIRVNAVAPGPIWTPIQPATRPAEDMTELGGTTPMGRAGQPSELAPAYVFLASPADASYVSGTVLGVTGGMPVF